MGLLLLLCYLRGSSVYLCDVLNTHRYSFAEENGTQNDKKQERWQERGTNLIHIIA